MDQSQDEYPPPEKFKLLLASMERMKFKLIAAPNIGRINTTTSTRLLQQMRNMAILELQEFSTHHILIMEGIPCMAKSTHQMKGSESRSSDGCDYASRQLDICLDIQNPRYILAPNRN